MAAFANSNDDKRDLSNIVGLTSDLLCIAHTDGYFKKLNQAWTDILGYSLDELLSRPIFDFIHPDDHAATEKEIGKQTNGKTTLNFTNRYLAKDGSCRWLEWRAAPADPDGYLYAAARDITERVRINEMLKESEERHRALFNAESDAIVVIDTDTLLNVDANPAASDLYGYSRDELLSMRSTDLSAEPEDTKKQIRTRDGLVKIPLRYHRKKDGTVFPVEITARFFEFKGKRLLLATMRDITERKRIEDSLLESEIKFRSVFENSVDAIGVSKKGVHVFVNPAYLKLFGYQSNEELAGKPVLDLIARSERERITDYIKRRANGEPIPTAYETVGLRKNGTEFCFDINVSLYRFKDELYTLVIIRDITEKKAAEQAVKESEGRLRLIFDASLAGIVLGDPEGTITFANRFMTDMFGYELEELIGLPYLSLVHPDERSDTKLSMLINGEIKFANLERHYIRKDGTDFRANLSARRQEDENGKLVNLVGIITDITERKKTEDALLSSEKRFRDMLENIQLIAVILDDKGKITFCNDYLLRLTGWSRDEVINRNWFEIFVPPHIRDTVKTFFDSSIASASIPSHYENPIVTRHGAELNVVWDNTTMSDAYGRCIGTASIGIDVTEHRRLESQLRQSQKMEAVGHLAGGVAHDFNNILTAIIGYAGLLKNRFSNSDNVSHDYAQQILAASQKAADLTQSLLAFSRKQLLDPKPIDINEVVCNMQKILCRLIGEDIELKVIESGPKLIVKADKGQIEHALINLATNARDAMPNGGTLTISSGLDEIDGGFVQTHGYGDAGPYAVISVSDTGSGISETIKQHIFEPFFTTKEVGKGTGLGLAMVYGTIKQHNGFIIVQSEQGEGSTFRIYLPLSGKEQETDIERTDHKIIAGNETILLIEDDEFVREVTSALMQELGYTVIEAKGGEEAKRLFNENKDRVQLVVSDVIMPGQSGKDVYEDLLKIKPDLKALFISGYASQVLSEKGFLGEGINFIPKPFKSDTLSRKIREALS